jgi:GR25 family glycosyltransferase involved in LPS biosynthesis
MVSICLNMIVKNESHIICKTFDNILKYVPITYWVISDTGSTDNTIELIKSYWKEKNIDGELIEHAWKDFGYNRTKALECAYNKTDYLLIFDADDRFHGDFKIPVVLDKDSYNLKFGVGFEYVRPLLINNRRRWKFVGVLHEFLACCEPNAVSATIDGNYHVESGRTGNRSQDPKKYEKDAKVLEMACQTERDTSLTDRYSFYCAQSWKDAGEPDNAILWYKKCLTLNNWYQEKYYSCLMIGNLYKQKGENMEALKYWLMTTEYDSERMEGIAEAIHLLRESGMNLFVCALYKKYRGYQKRPKDKLFIDITKYDSIIEYNTSISAYYCDKKDMGIECCRKILMDENASPSIIFATFGNIQFYDVKPDATLFERVDELICSLSRTGHSMPPSAFEVWNKLINKSQLTKYSPIKNKKLTKSPTIILTMTTCKRFDLFQQTVNSITNTWTDIDMIDYWFCVDDNSSHEDRTQMKKKYNWIDYYMKGPKEKGHRKSMNIIWDKLNELRPTYWIHMEDDFRFHCRMDYIKTGIKYLENNIKQVLFNRNYGEQTKDYSISGHTPFGATQEIVLHDHKSGSFNYPNCHYWTDYSFRPSIIKVDAIIALGNYDSPNQFFEKDYADRWYGAGYRSAFFNRITCEHIGKLTSDRAGENAYTMNDESQFVKKTELLLSETKQLGPTKFEIKVVNLERRPDRKEQTIAKFKEQGIVDYKFIEAVDGQKLDVGVDIIELFKGNDYGSRKGFIGCALSHYNLWKQLLQSSDEYYYIMEDDVSIEPDYYEKIKSIDYLKYDILFLGYSMFSSVREKIEPIDVFSIGRLPMSQYVGGTFAYSINRTGAKKMIDYIEKNGIKHGIDYLFKIIPELECYESKPQLCFSEWNENGNKIDSDIQNMGDTFDFEKILMNKYEYYPKQDFYGRDIHFQRETLLIDKLIIAEKLAECVCFNTFGFYKNAFDSNNLIKIEGDLYVKKTAIRSDNRIHVRVRVRMMCDWCSSEQLCREWSNMCLDGMTWKNIEITWDTENIDYYVIINRTNETGYDKSRTIVFQMEPWVYDEGKNWGVKTWGDWSVPTGFMKVFAHRGHLNNVQWQIPRIDVGIEKDDKIISILSKKNFDEGHIKRIEFIRRLEECGFDGVDVYGVENYHNYKNYVGTTSDKSEMARYKYCFSCENNWEKNYATEKIWEPILCECLCFYWGCPNLEEYIDSGAFVRLDLNDFEGSMALVKRAIEEDWWGARIDIIQREKRKILEEIGFFPNLKKMFGV